MFNILVVEDEEAIRLGLVDVLELEGYNVKEALNGEQAVELALTDRNAWGETNLAPISGGESQVEYDPQVDRRGPLCVAMAVTADPDSSAVPGDKTRIVVFGDADFARNQHFGQQVLTIESETADYKHVVFDGSLYLLPWLLYLGKVQEIGAGGVEVGEAKPLGIYLPAVPGGTPVTLD